MTDKYVPSTDTYSNEYRLDCLAKHKLKTQPANVIRKWLSKLTDEKFKVDMQIRLNHFKDEAKAQHENNEFKQLPYAIGVKQCREALRSGLVNQGKLKNRKTK